MQYALIEVGNGKRVLMAANELAYLHRFGDGIVDQQRPDEASTPFTICYGCYMPNNGIGEGKAMEDFGAAKDHWLGYAEDDKCHVIALHDAQAMPAVRIGMAVRIPFAALIQADEGVVGKIIASRRSRQAVTAFLRYHGMSPGTNILNRYGLLALKGVERRVGGCAISLADWRLHIDRARIMRGLDIR
jgi:hypothetical protein